MISRRSLLFVGGCLVLTGAGIAHSLGAVAGLGAPVALGGNEEPTSRDVWVAKAAHLVDAADSGLAPASSFRREVSEMRGNLRELVRSTDPEKRAALNDLVLMIALLDAAAACHRGGVIVCPPDLMREMRSQLSRLMLAA